MRRRLAEEIDAMHRAVTHWIGAVWRRNPPEMAQDEVSADELRGTLEMLSTQWLRRFDTLAAWLGDYFSRDVADRSDAALASSLRKHGMSVRFVPTPAVRDVIRASTHESVSLIKSIPQKYLGDVEGIVMRGVRAGRDLSYVSSELQRKYGVTKKRAALIARDQNNKATSAVARARQIELGISEAIWVHSHAGKKPRPTHVRMDGKRYDVTKGMYDSAEGRRVFPGELINCRCVSRSVVPGFA